MKKQNLRWGKETVPPAEYKNHVSTMFYIDSFRMFHIHRFDKGIVFFAKILGAIDVPNIISTGKSPPNSSMFDFIQVGGIIKQ